MPDLIKILIEIYIVNGREGVKATSFLDRSFYSSRKLLIVLNWYPACVASLMNVLRCWLSGPPGLRATSWQRITVCPPAWLDTPDSLLRRSSPPYFNLHNEFHGSKKIWRFFWGINPKILPWNVFKEQITNFFCNPRKILMTFFVLRPTIFILNTQHEPADTPVHLPVQVPAKHPGPLGCQ